LGTSVRVRRRTHVPNACGRGVRGIRYGRAVPSLLGWVGALGAWLLFAGPIYQAALELDAEEVERDELAALATTVDQPARISSWWWLLPPVGYVLNLRRRRAYRKAAFDAMSPTLRRQFVTFADKAAGWALVAAGALLL